MAKRDQKTAEVLFSGHHWWDIIKVSIQSISSPAGVSLVHVVYHSLLDDVDRVVGSDVEVSSY